ncbi:MAG: LuxR C-terminal-related transcriptional regulator [Acidimicrobiales bacterium]
MPTGTVTFLFTDIESSTRSWDSDPAGMDAALRRHDEILRGAIETRNGYVFSTAGDGFAAAFCRAEDAIIAAIDAQRSLSEESLKAVVPLNVRMGLLTGEAYERDGDYFGPTVNRAARIMDSGHGGQIVIGATTAAVMDGVELIDLGRYRLKGLTNQEHLFQASAAGLPVDFPTLRAVNVRLGNLPAPMSTLVGRDEEIEVVSHLVSSHRLVTVIGAGGVGKTRLGIAVATRLAEDFSDGVVLVELAAVSDDASVPDAIATALGVAPQPNISLNDAVAAAMSGRRILMVFDNCEHVTTGAAEAVSTILTRTNTVKVLTTSREALWVNGEQRFGLLPLDLKGDTASPAVVLFIERARAVRPGFELTDPPTATAVTDICRRLDGLPLAIELAAARMVSMTPVDVLDRLDHRFRLLTGDEHHTARHQTLGQAIDWSYELLDEAERHALRCASVCVGGFDLAAINAVVGDVDEIDMLGVLESLVRKSLVNAGEAGGRARYSLLETIRQFAEDALINTGAAEQYRDRHAAHFADEAVAHWEKWFGPGAEAGADWADRELANLRAAFRWSTDRADAVVSSTIAAHAASLGISLQLFEPIGWAEEVADLAAEAAVPYLPRVLAAAGIACFIGRPDQAVIAAQAAVRLEGDDRYRPLEHHFASLIEALAQVYSGHLDRYVEITSELAKLPGPTSAFGMPALVDGLQASGRADEAMALADEALAAARALGSPFLITYALWTYGAAFARTEPRRALAAWQEGLATARQHRVLLIEGFIARDAARLDLADADPDEALGLLDAAIASFYQAGNIAQLTITLASATSLFGRMGLLEVAATLHGAIAHQPGSDHHVPDLSDVARQLASRLGTARYEKCQTAGAVMDLGDTAHWVREQIQVVRSHLAPRASRHASPPGSLSRREIDVLRLMAEGLTTKEIAERLYISAKTADHHIQHIYTKIGMKGRVATIRWAMEHDLI